MTVQEKGINVHIDMIGACGSRREAYTAYQREYKRDSTKLHITDVATGLAVAYLAYHYLGEVEAFAACVAVFGSVSAIRQFIDQSSRNYMMHHFDWDMAGPDDPRG